MTERSKKKGDSWFSFSVIKEYLDSKSQNYSWRNGGPVGWEMQSSRKADTKHCITAIWVLFSVILASN